MTQSLVALSSGEAELYAILRGSVELRFIKSLLSFFDHVVDMELETDSSAAKGAALRLGAGKRMRHLEMNVYHIQDLLNSKAMSIVKIPGTKNIADIGTKYLPKDTLIKLIQLVGAIWLAEGVPVSEALEIKDGDEQNLVFWDPMSYYQSMTKEEIIMLVVIMSVIVNVCLKLGENLFLDCVKNSVVKIYAAIKSCFYERRQSQVQSIDIRLMQARGSQIMHYVDCEAAKQVKVANREEKTSCSKCERVFEKDLQRYVDDKIREITENLE